MERTPTKDLETALKMQMISRIVSELATGGDITPTLEHEISALANVSPIEIIDSVITYPPLIRIVGNDYEPNIRLPTRKEHQIADTDTTQIFSVNDDGNNHIHLATTIDYLALPQFPLSDSEFPEWSQRVSNALGIIDSHPLRAEEKKSLTNKFNDVLTNNQQETAVVTSTMKALTHLADNKTLNKNLVNKLSAINQTIDEQDSYPTAEYLRSLVISCYNNILDSQNERMARQVSREIDTLSTEDALQRLVTKVFAAQQNNRSIQKFSDLTPEGILLVNKLGILVVDDPYTILLTIADSLPSLYQLSADNTLSQIKPDFQSIQATTDEKKAAELINSIDISEMGKLYLKTTLVPFLTSPRTYDGLTDHQTERQPWEKAFMASLALVAKRAKEKSSNPEDVPQIETIFNDVWTRTKFSKNARLKVISGLQMVINYGLNESDPRKQQIEDLLEEMKQKKYTEQYLDKDSDVETVTNDISRITQTAMYILANLDLPTHLIQDLETEIAA